MSAPKTMLAMAGAPGDAPPRPGLAAALDLGFRAIVPAAATATRELPDPTTGSTVPASTLRAATLAALSGRFATVVAGETRIPA